MLDGRLFQCSCLWKLWFSRKLSCNEAFTHALRKHKDINICFLVLPLQKEPLKQRSTTETFWFLSTVCFWKAFMNRMKLIETKTKGWPIQARTSRIQTCDMLQCSSHTCLILIVPMFYVWQVYQNKVKISKVQKRQGENKKDPFWYLQTSGFGVCQNMKTRNPPGGLCWIRWGWSSYAGGSSLQFGFQHLTKKPPSEAVAFEVPRQGLSRTARSGGFYPSFPHGRDSNLIELGFNVAGRCGLYWEGSTAYWSSHPGDKCLRAASFKLCGAAFLLR